MKYTAVWSVGSSLPGDEVKGLDAERVQALLDLGAIKAETVQKAEAEAPTKPTRKAANTGA